MCVLRSTCLSRNKGAFVLDFAGDVLAGLAVFGLNHIQAVKCLSLLDSNPLKDIIIELIGSKLLPVGFSRRSEPK